MLSGKFGDVYFVAQVGWVLDPVKPLSHAWILATNPGRIRIRPGFDPNGSGSNPDCLHMDTFTSTQEISKMAFASAEILLLLLFCESG